MCQLNMNIIGACTFRFGIEDQYILFSLQPNVCDVRTVRRGNALSPSMLRKCWRTSLMLAPNVSRRHPVERLLVISQLINPSDRPGMNQSGHFLLEGYVSDVLVFILLPTCLSK